MKYNKLVRDKIPEIIKAKGSVAISHIANDVEYWDKLKTKLQEEVSELLQEDAKFIEELADVLEVVHTMCDFKKIPLEELESLRKKKKDERGGFKDKIILDETI